MGGILPHRTGRGKDFVPRSGQDALGPTPHQTLDTRSRAFCLGSDIHGMLTLRRRSRQVVVTNEKESREMLDFLPFVKSDFYFLPAHLSTCQKRSLSRVIQRAIT